MSFVAIKVFELKVREFFTTLNCSFIYAFLLCKLIFLYRYLKKMCDLLYLNLLCINLGSFNIPILFIFIDNINFYNGITSCTILTLVQLYSGIFYTTFLTTRTWWCLSGLLVFKSQFQGFKWYIWSLNLIEWSWNRFFLKLEKICKKIVCITFYKIFMVLELFKLENRQQN